MPFIRTKGEAEVRLMNSGMTWTVLQPNLYMDTWLPMAVGGPALAGQPVTLVGEGRRRHSMVAMRDVVSYAVAALDRNEANNARFIIGGPEPISWWDAIAAFEHELGRKIPVRTVSPGEPVPGMPEPVRELFQQLETYDSPLDMRAAAATYRIPPTTLKTLSTPSSSRLWARRRPVPRQSVGQEMCPEIRGRASGAERGAQNLSGDSIDTPNWRTT